MNQKAKLLGIYNHTIKAAHRREKHFTREIVAISPKTRRPVVTLRLYEANTTTACLWVHGTYVGAPYHEASSGRAGGYGYHKASAAAGDAISKLAALSQAIDGRGDNAIVEAVEALAKALGTPKPIMHEAHS